MTLIDRATELAIRAFELGCIAWVGLTSALALVFGGPDDYEEIWH